MKRSLVATRALLVGTILLSIVVGAAAMPSPPLGDEAAGTGGDPVHFLRLKAGTFDPLVEGYSWVPPAYRLAASSPAGDLYVVQFDEKVKVGQRAEMLATGARYHSYLPDDAFLVSATASELRALKALPFVRVVLPWQPYFRLAPELRVAGWTEASGEALVSVENFGDGSRLTSFAAAHGATVIQQDGAYATLSIPRSLLVPIASLPTVAWVDPFEPRVLDNYNSAIIQGARQVPNGPFSPNLQRLWSFNPATGLYEGTTGRGVTVAVGDTGLDTTHPAFNGRIVFLDGMGAGSTPSGGHGTHTAGTVLGDGAWRASDSAIAVPGKYAGMAPEAGLVVENIFASGSSNTQAGIDNAAHGVSISSNSWASGGSYDGDARLYDTLARDSWPDTSNASSIGLQPVLYFFSAGNAGGSGKAYNIASPSQGKNVISVGATDDITGSQMASFSSRGPGDDDRIKPDLVAPGADVMSAMWSGGGFGNPQGTSYGEASGTSMSCPGAARSAAVAWQYFRDKMGFNPSPDMIKAILVNGADEMSPYPVLGTDQGFGRINLSTSLLSLPNRMQIWKDGEASLETDDEVVYTYPIADSLQPFAVTLAWLDEPGDSGANPAIVNDLDLWVEGPNGEIYRGNAMDNTGNSIANGPVDKLNTVEKVKVNTPTRGYYVVHIKGSNVPVGPQDFSLAIRGNMVTDWYDITMERVQTNASSPIEGNAVTFNATLWNRGTQWVNGSSVTLEAVTAQGTSPVGTFLPGSIAPNARFDLQTNWTTLRGTVNFIARVSPPGGQSEFSATNNVANRSFFVRGYGFTLQNNGQAGYALDPGGSASVTFNITQTGNVQDNFTTAVYTDNAAIPAYLDFARLQANPGQTKQFHLTAIVPLSAKAQERVNISVVVRSLSDARLVSSFTTAIVVNHLYGYTFTMSPNHTALAPTVRSSAVIMIENRGNGPDRFTLSSNFIPAGWTFTFDPPAVALMDNSTATINIDIRAPDRVDAGTRSVISVRTASEGAPPQTLEFEFNITQVYGWTAGVVAPTIEASPSALLEFPISALNLGNGVDRVVVTVAAPPNWASSLTRSQLFLLPYTNLSSTAWITVDQWALAGDYTIRFTFGGDRNFTTQTVSVRVKMLYRLEVAGPDYTIQMGQGEVNTVEAVVVSGSNGPASVTPVVTAPEGVTIVPVVSGAILERNSTARFTFTIIVARDAPDKLQDFTVDFRTGEDGSESNVLTLHIDVHKVVEPVPEIDAGGTGGASTLMNGLLAVLIVVGAAVPVGYLYIRRKATKNAPPPQVIVQTVEDANSGSTYDPTKGYTPGGPAAPAAPAAAAAVRAPRAPRSSTQSPAAMSFVGVCKNCGGGVIDLGTGMGRCVSCGIEQIVRPGRR